MIQAPPAGIKDSIYLQTLAGVRALIIVQQQDIPALREENDDLRVQRTALVTELPSLRKRIDRSSCNFSKPPCSDGPVIRRKSVARPVAARAAGSWAIPDRLPLRRVTRASGGGSSALAPSGDRDPADHTAGYRASPA